MNSTASTSQVDESRWASNSRSIHTLEEEVKYLNKIIMVKDHALQELDKLFKEELSLSKDNLRICQNMSAVLTSFMQDHADSTKTQGRIQELRNELSGFSFDYLNYYQMKQDKLLKWHNESAKILKNVGWSEYKNKKDFFFDQKNHTRNNIRQAIVYEVPVQLKPQKHTENVSIQADLFQAPANTEQNEIFISEVARPITSEIVEIPVEINHTHEIEVHMIKVQEIPTELVQIIEIPVELLVLHQIPVVVKRVVEVPIELELMQEEDQQTYPEIRNGASESIQFRNSVQLKSQAELKNSMDGLGEFIELKGEFIELQGGFIELQGHVERLREQNVVLKRQNEQLRYKINQLGNSRKFFIQMGDLVYEIQDCESADKAQIPVEIVVENQTGHELSVALDGITQSLQPLKTKNITLEQFKTSDQLESRLQNHSRKGSDDNIGSLNMLSPNIRCERPKSILQINDDTSPFRQHIIRVQQEDHSINLKAEEGKQIEESCVQKQPGEISKIHELQAEIDELPQALQVRYVPFHQIREIPVELIIQQHEIRQIPVELIVEKEVIKEVIVEREIVKEIYKQVIKQVQRQIIKQKEVERLTANEVPVIKEIPVEVLLQTITEIPVVYEVPVELLVEVQSIKEVIVLKEIPVEVIVVQEVPVEVITYVPVEVIKQVRVEVIKYIQVPIIKEVVKEQTKQVKTVEYVAVVRQVPVQVIVEKEVILEKIIEKYIQTPVYVKIPVIRQIPVELTHQLQKIVYVKIPFIEQIPVEVITEVPVIHQVPVQLLLPQYQQIERLAQKSGQNAAIITEPLVLQTQSIVPPHLQAQPEPDLDGQNAQPYNPNAQAHKQKGSAEIVRQIYQIPIELVQQRVVDRFIQIQRITHFTTTSYIEVKQFVDVPVEKEKFVPYVVEIPVELNLFQAVYQDTSAAEIVAAQNYTSQEIQQIEDLEREIGRFCGNTMVVEVPVECIVQKYIQIQKAVAQVCEIPVFCELQKIREVEKVVYVDRIVEIQKTVEIQKVVEVEKIVQVQKIVELQVLRQVLKIVQVQKIVQVPIYQQVQKTVYVYTDRIVQVPVEVIVQVIKQVTAILEVPVQIQLQALHWPQLIEVPVEMDVRYINQNPVILEVPVEMFMQIEFQNCPIVDREMIREVEKIVDRIVQVERIVEVERIVQVEVEKIVQIQKIVQVVVEKVVEKFIPYVVQIPVELQSYTELIQIPVQLYTTPQIYEVALEVIPPVTPYEFPVPLGSQPQIAELPVQLKSKRVQLQAATIAQPKQREQLGSEYIIIDIPYKPMDDIPYKSMEEIAHKPMEEIAHKQREMVEQMKMEFAGQLGQQMQRGKGYASHQVQTEEERFMMDIEMVSNIDKIQNLNRLDSNSEGGMQSMLKVWEIPVELELDYNLEEMQRTIELRYKEKYAQLATKYSAEIDELHLTIDSLQKVLFELNQQKLELTEAIQADALRHEDFKQTLCQLEAKDERNEQMIVNLMQETETKGEIITRQKEENQLLELRLQRMIQRPLLQQLPIEINISTEKEHCEVQTDDLSLFESVEVIQLAIELGQVERIPGRLLNLDEKQTEQAAVQTEQPYFDSEQSNNRAELALIPQCQLSDKQTPQYSGSSKQENRVDMAKIYGELQGSSKLKIEGASSYCQYMMVSGMQIEADYQNVIDNLQIYQIPLEIAVDPVVYQLPVYLKEHKQTNEIQTQTDHSFPLLPQVVTEVLQMPVELIFDHDCTDRSYHSLADHEKHIPCYIKINDRSSKVAFTDYDSDMVGKDDSMSNYRRQGGAIKEKPYSEYYSSRIIEIPIELEINQCSKDDKKLSLVKVLEIFIKGIENGEKPVGMQEGKEIKIASSLQTSNIYNMHYQTSFHGYNPNNTYINDSFEKIRTPEEIAILINKPDRAQKQPQDNQAVPEQAKEAKLQELGKPELAARRKYDGFYIQQSSIQNITLNRQMVIEEESQSNNSMDFNRMRSPHLEITQLNYSDYANVRDKVMEIEQQRNSYQHLYQQMLRELQDSKHMLSFKDEEVFAVKNLLDKEIARYEEELKRADEDISSLFKLNKEMETSIDQYKSKSIEQELESARLQDRIEKMEEGYEKLKEDSDKIESALNEENERLKKKLQDLKYDYRESKLDYQHNQHDYRAQIAELKDFIQQKVDYIHGLEDELQKKDNKLEQLTQSHEQLRKNIASLRRNQENDPAQIYEQQFERVRQLFQEQKAQLKAEIAHLNHELEMSKGENKEQKEEMAHLQIEIEELREQVDQARRENSKLGHIKSEIEQNYIIGIKQMEQIRDIIKEKDQLLERYQQQPDGKAAYQTFPNTALRESAEFRIEYLSRQNSQIDSKSDNSNYIVNLQNLILKYERMLIEDQKQIEEYQEKVCEYLRDALDKEQEAESLFGKVVQYEATLNYILVEKVTLEVQNKRLARAVDMSQRKVEALGAKMLEAMGLRYSEQQQSEKYYHYR